MAKIELSNISHSYNPNEPNPIYALNPFSMTWENGKRIKSVDWIRLIWIV